MPPIFAFHELEAAAKVMRDPARYVLEPLRRQPNECSNGCRFSGERKSARCRVSPAVYFASQYTPGFGMGWQVFSKRAGSPSDTKILGPSIKW